MSFSLIWKPQKIQDKFRKSFISILIIEKAIMGNIKSEVLDDIDNIKNQWNSLLKISNLSSYFHKYEWLKTIEDGLKIKPKHIIIKKDNNLLGVFPNFIKPKDFHYKKEKFNLKKLESITLGYCGPIIISNEKESIDLMFKSVKEICEENKIDTHKILSNNINFLRYADYLKLKNYIPFIGVNFTIDLSKNYEEIFNSYSNSKKRQIKKARKNKFEIKIEDLSDNSIAKFYKIYEKTMKCKKIIPYPISFFLKMNKCIQESAKIFFYEFNDELISTNFVLLDKNSIFSLFVGSDKSHLHKYPNIILNDEIVKWGKKNNYVEYNLGDVTAASFDDKLFRFKEQIGKIYPVFVWESIYSKKFFNSLLINKR
jgi:hypothetical protein